MLTVLHVTLPVFALILCGWVAARQRWLSPEGARGINIFVFLFALPAMMFRAVSSQPIARIAEPRFLIAYLLSALLMIGIARWLGRHSAPGQPTQHIAFGFSATHGNVGYLGLPLAAQLGDSTRLPGMVMALLVEILVVIVVCIVMFEFARANAGTDRSATLLRLKDALTGLLRTPLLLAIFAGLAFALGGWSLSGPLDTFVKLLGSAAGPAALFAIGASLGDRRIRLDSGVPLQVSLKLLIHPLLVAAMMFLLGVDPQIAAVGILAASLPTASNVFILSERYGADTRPLGAAIALGTALAVITVSLVIWLLDLTATS
jgi:predicted permease